MSRAAKMVGLGASVLAGAGVAAFVASRRAVPSYDKPVSLKGLRGKVEVVRDEWGVPAIFADEQLDGFMVQGYVQASERLFQMDLLRRIGFGRLSEIVGEQALGSDRLMRVLGLGRHATAELDLISDDSRAALQAFARGVNQFIAGARLRLPVEFRVLAYRPELWKPEHSLVVPKLMAFSMCGNWQAEMVRAEIADIFGIDVLNILDDNSCDEVFSAQIDQATLGELFSATREATTAFGSASGSGSNNWVVAPEHTSTGGALLANDPHLDLGIPSVWFENALHAGELTVRGFAMVGTPGIALGTNGRISWGYTNSCADVQDLYHETIDTRARTYRDTDGSWKPLDVRTERIKVRGGGTRQLTVRSTRRGPLLTDAVDSTLEHAYSIRWDSLLPGRIVDAAFKLNEARNWDEFRDALRLWSAPSQNVVYADRDGNIGFQFCGEVPIRASGNGSVPAAGDDPQGEWVGTIPFEELPAAFNPQAGRIVTANDRIVSDDFPHFISREWMNGYRGQRIAQRLASSSTHDVKSQQSIQCDLYSIPGEQLVAIIRQMNLKPTTEAGSRVLRALRHWNFRLAPEDEGAEAYRVVWRSLQELVFGFLGDRMLHFLGHNRSGMSGFWSLWSQTTPRLLDALREDDTALLELGADVDRRGLAPADWVPLDNWHDAMELAIERAGEVLHGGARHHGHRVRFQHPLGVIKPLALLVSKGPYPVGGDTETVWQSTAFENPNNDLAMVGPSQRMVFDMANLDDSACVLAGGQSGHPASPHYADQVHLWRTAQLRPAPFTPEAIRRLGRATQQFTPA